MKEGPDLQGGEFCPTGTPSSLVTEDSAKVQAVRLLLFSVSPVWQFFFF